MGYNEIFLGTQANDGSGDDARTGGGKINSNFKELYSTLFVWNNLFISRRTFDPQNLKFEEFVAEDKVEGWEDVTTKNRRVEGIVLQLPFVWPDDIDNEAKFFITNDRRK